MFGRLYIPTGSVRPLTVSKRALQRIGEIELVWVLSQGKPERRYVRTGRTYEDRVEVLSGLNEGDTVIMVSPKEAKMQGQRDQARLYAHPLYAAQENVIPAKAGIHWLILMRRDSLFRGNDDAGSGILL
jgi:hypothetical protein